MILILTASVTARLEYIFSLLLKEMLGLDYSITNSREQWNAYEGPKFCYAREPVGDSLFIESAGLLFESVVFPHDLKIVHHEGTPVLFESTHPGSEPGFDPFAAAFYMVSRYEEYHRSKKDKFGRFIVSESIAWQGKFLEIPVVHHWVSILESTLLKHFPALKMSRRTYSFVPTIDIDHAFAYRARTIGRTAGSIGRSVIKGHFGEIGRRLRVMTGTARDPYDNYGFIRSVHEKFGVKPLWFILFADYGGNDNQVSTRNREFRDLISGLDRDHTVGIHPSLSSGKHPEKLESEIRGLSGLLGRDVTISRQHFLKISFPKTYRSLLQLGITDDYSMGYASHPGFRAGMAIPFRFFDLSRNETTNLMIHPVAIMDVTLKDYSRLNAQQSLEAIREVIQKVRSVNGVFISLWHNESLSDTGHWQGWRKVYRELLREAAG
ncbi:MAG: polysaccharide deacetylase family protein [bacterium]